MANDTLRAIDLDEMVPGVVVLRAVDAAGDATDDPVAMVEGEIVVTYRDGRTRHIAMDRTHGLPPVTMRT